MKPNNKKTMQKGKKQLRRVFSRRKFSNVSVQKLVTNRRGVNAVISNLILITAVLVIGFAVLSWASSQSAQFQRTQTGAITKDINQLQERLSFEYVVYSGSTLKVYIMNTGTVSSVNVTSIQIGSDLPTPVDNLYSLSGTSLAGLNIGQDGYFSVSRSLTPGTNFAIKVMTSRGSSFVSTFTA